MKRRNKLLRAAGSHCGELPEPGPGWDIQEGTVEDALVATSPSSGRASTCVATVMAAAWPAWRIAMCGLSAVWWDAWLSCSGTELGLRSPFSGQVIVLPSLTPTLLKPVRTLVRLLQFPVGSPAADPTSTPGVCTSSMNLWGARATHSKSCSYVGISKSKIYHYTSQISPHPHFCLYHVIKQIRFFSFRLDVQVSVGLSWALSKSVGFRLLGARACA